MKISDISESLNSTNPCWKGYKPVGTKKKNNKTVPNCVPKENVEESNLSEIGFAHELGKLSLSDQQIIQQSKVDGHIGQRDVFKMKTGNNRIYFFSRNDKIEALLLLDGNRLAAIKNFTENKGLVFGLFNYVVNMKGEKLRIDANDQLTPYGIDWILKQLERSDGFKITDLSGKPIDKDLLKKEWGNSRVDPDRKTGPTGIMIGESIMAKRLKENENSLMPYDIFGVSENKNIAENKPNKLHVKKLLTDQEVIQHVRLHTKNLSLDNVPRTQRNIYPTICSTVFALSRTSLNESTHIKSGRKLIEIMKQLDQFSKLDLKVGSNVAIINYQLQGDWCELWGFTTPKTITNILRDNDDAITQFEFNNDPEDVWPRTEHAEYNGNFITNTAFFADKKSAVHAISMITLSCSDNLNIKNHIKDNMDQKLNEETISVGDTVWAKHPTQKHKILTGKVMKINDISTQIQHKDGSTATYPNSSVSTQYEKLNPNPYKRPKQGLSEGTGESFIIVRTNSEGKKDVFAGNFGSYEKAQKELDACLAHPLHTKYKQKFEIKKKSQGLSEESNSEYDDEAGMADNNLETLKRAVEGIDDLINNGDNLPEWCQEKIAVAKSTLVSVWDYMKSEENSEQVAEGSIGNKIKGAAKSVKRAAQGWGIGSAPDMITPKGVVQAFGNMDGQRLANFVASRKDFSKPGKDSARAFADKVIDREMKQRGYGRVVGKDEQGVAEGWKEKVAGVTIGAAALGGIGAGIAYSPMAYVNGQQIHMAMPGSIPDNAKLVTDDSGKKIYVWKSSNIKGNRHGLLYRPAEKQIKEQGMAEGNYSSDPWGPQGNFAGDTPVQLGGDTVKPLGVGSIVSYFGEKFKIAELNSKSNYARITNNGKTLNAKLSDLKRTGGSVTEGSQQDAHKMALEKLQKALKNPNVPAVKKAEIAKQIQYHRSQLQKGVTEDWQKVNKKDKTDGMSPKAVKAYRKENPGSKLKTAVTKKPSELKAGSKDANRRKSFCARMGGAKKNASAETRNNPDSPVNKALRRWNCESVEQLEQLVMIAEQHIRKNKKSK